MLQMRLAIVLVLLAGWSSPTRSEELSVSVKAIGILNRYCTSCHGPGAQPGSGWMRFPS